MRRCMEECRAGGLVELRRMLGVDCSISAICMALQKLKLTYKKR